MVVWLRYPVLLSSRLLCSGRPHCLEFLMEADGNWRVKKLCIVKTVASGPRSGLAVQPTKVAEEPARMSGNALLQNIAEPGMA